MGHGEGWAARNRIDIESALGDANNLYPCHFGVGAQLRGENVHLDVDLGSGLGNRVLDDIAAALRTFLERSETTVGRERPTLLCALGPPTTSTGLEQDQELFWTLLSRLRAHDTSAWPTTVPADPDDPCWSFCFAGHPMFVFALSPHYRRRRSRAIARTLTVCFQASTVFHDISGSTEAGRRAKARVRARLAAYEDAPLIGALGDGQSSTVDKWKQYFPNDDGTSDAPQCPLSRTRRHGPSSTSGGE